MSKNLLHVKPAQPHRRAENNVETNVYDLHIQCSVRSKCRCSIVNFEYFIVTVVTRYFICVIFFYLQEKDSNCFSCSVSYV